MQKLTSKDGTEIAYDKTGTGEAVILVGGVLGDRSQQAPLAALLAKDFTVFNYDRRGHGESGDTPPFLEARIEHEAEDLTVLIEAAGGSANVYGTSGCAILALEIAARRPDLNIKKLALWEPPYIMAGSRPPIPPDFMPKLQQMLAKDQRGEMIRYYMTKGIGMPAPIVWLMPLMPGWTELMASAQTLVYDLTWLGDYALPAERIATVNIPALVIDGGKMPWLTRAAQAVADTLPNAQRSTLDGQPHNVDPAAIAPVLAAFFNA